MKTAELRIGNYVWDDYSGEMIVSGILVHTGLKEELRLKKRNGLPEGSFICETILPIPLKEEWLMKFGFTQDENGSFWKDKITHYLELNDYELEWYPAWVQLPELSSEQEQRVGMNCIMYVHQLQNLYFALTGEELTINQ